MSGIALHHGKANSKHNNSIQERPIGIKNISLCCSLTALPDFVLYFCTLLVLSFQKFCPKQSLRSTAKIVICKPFIIHSLCVFGPASLMGTSTFYLDKGDLESNLGWVATSSRTGAFGPMKRGACCEVGQIIKLYELAILSSLYWLKTSFKLNQQVNLTELLELPC